VNVRSTLNVFSGHADLIRATALIIWDELPAANISTLEAADNICRQLTQKNVPLGGIPFLGMGDFHQVAPVVKGHGCTPALLASIKNSYLWHSFQIGTLLHPYRSATDPVYTRLVDVIGEDSQNSKVDLTILLSVSTIDDCIDFLYPPNVLQHPAACLRHSFLSPKNSFVDEFNIVVLQKLSHPTRCYYSSDVIKEDSDNDDHPDYTPDYLALLTHNGIPAHELLLKEGCICSLMRNMSISKGLVKNARVVVDQLHHRFAEIRLIDPCTSELGESHCIPCIRFDFVPARSSWTVQRLQLPLRLAYATTFHSCVGLLDRTVIDSRCPVFSHGQLYTALSRVRRSIDSRLFIPDAADHLLTNISPTQLCFL
jgi:hypothetical protein